MDKYYLNDASGRNQISESDALSILSKMAFQKRPVNPALRLTKTETHNTINEFGIIESTTENEYDLTFDF